MKYFALLSSLIFSFNSISFNLDCYGTKLQIDGVTVKEYPIADACTQFTNESEDLLVSKSEGPYLYCDGPIMFTKKGRKVYEFPRSKYCNTALKLSVDGLVCAGKTMFNKYGNQLFYFFDSHECINSIRNSNGQVFCAHNLAMNRFGDRVHYFSNYRLCIEATARAQKGHICAGRFLKNYRGIRVKKFDFNKSCNHYLKNML